MTISPPDNGFRTSAAPSSGEASIVKRPHQLEAERNFKIWQASPEGQAAASKQAADDAEEQLELKEYFAKHGIGGEDSTSGRHKKHAKHHQKDTPHKKTGMLHALAEKFSKKK